MFAGDNEKVDSLVGGGWSPMEDQGDLVPKCELGAEADSRVEAVILIGWLIIYCIDEVLNRRLIL